MFASAAVVSVAAPALGGSRSPTPPFSLPASGPAEGGTRVVVAAALERWERVQFGSVVAPCQQSIGSGKTVVVAPAGDPGPVGISVSNLLLSPEKRRDLGRAQLTPASGSFTTKVAVPEMAVGVYYLTAVQGDVSKSTPFRVLARASAAVPAVDPWKGDATPLPGANPATGDGAGFPIVPVGLGALMAVVAVGSAAAEVRRRRAPAE